MILNNLAPLHWALSGVALAALTLTLLWVMNIRLGMSTGFESVCSIVSKHSYFRRDILTDTNSYRLALFAGLLAGGVISALLSGGWHPTWDMGRFDTLISNSPAVKTAWMFVGGILIGFGTRLGSGCTSGHAMVGVPSLQKGSIRAMIAFMIGGVVASNIVYRLLFVGEVLS